MVKLLEESGRDYAVIYSVEEVADSKSEFIVCSKRDLYCHPCPATKIYRCCNYYTTDVMEGCPFDCSYCILQAYLGHKNIQVSADLELITQSIRQFGVEKRKIRMGTGELSDSLALDHIFPYTKLLIPLVNEYDNIQFEFKTKSANIANLLNLNPRNIVVSWSLNPEKIVAGEEHLAAPVSKRLEAAKICAEAGYKVAFHFDPVISYDGWEKDYTGLIEMLANTVPEKQVEYISISTFRATSKLVETMRLRETTPEYLRGDFIRGLDGKTRYFKPLRKHMIRTVYENLRTYWKNTFIYLCMEHESIWEEVLGFDPGEREELEKLFPYRNS